MNFHNLPREKEHDLERRYELLNRELRAMLAIEGKSNAGYRGKESAASTKRGGFSEAQLRINADVCIISSESTERVHWLCHPVLKFYLRGGKKKSELWDEEIRSPWNTLWKQSDEEEKNICPGFIIFCCSNALLVFLRHHAAFSAAEHGRGGPQKGASFLVIPPNCFTAVALGKKSLVRFGGKTLRLPSKYFIASHTRISAILHTGFLPSLQLSRV